VALAHDGEQQLRLSSSRVRFAALSAAQIDAYVASGEPMGKAGAYAIQSQAASWVAVIHGSYSGIMGLPLYETAELLRGIGWAI
jgi:septum formation protein